jgi:hypothetical protein
MATWTETKQLTGYDQTDDLAQRAKVREDFAKNNGVDPNAPEIQDKFDQLGAFDKEKSFKQTQQQDYSAAQPLSPFEKMVSVGMQGPLHQLSPITQLVSQYTDLGNIDPVTSVPISSMNPEDAVNWMKNKAMGGQNAYSQGLMESPSYAADLDKLNPEARTAVVNYVNQNRRDLELSREQGSTGNAVLSKAGETFGTMSGSPSTLAMPVVGMVPGGAPAIGGIQGAENAYVQKQYGRDASYTKEIIKGIALGKLSMMGAGIGGKIATKLPFSGPITEFAGQTIGAGTVGGAFGFGEGLASGQDVSTSAKNSLTGMLGSTITGLPFAAAQHVQNKALPLPKPTQADREYQFQTGLKPEEMAQVMERVNAEPDKVPIQQKEIATALTNIDDMPFVKQAPVKDENVKRGFLFGLELIGDTQARALWRLNKAAQMDIAAGAEQYGGDKNAYLNAINRGDIPQPASIKMMERIKETPSADARSVLEANEQLADLYTNPETNKPFTPEEIKVLESYTNSRNLLNIYNRKAVAGERYILPDNQRPENLKLMVDFVEGNPQLQNIKDRADWVFKQSSNTLDELHRYGVITDADYTALKEAGDNLGVDHIRSSTMYETGEKSKNQKSASTNSPLKFLKEGSPLPINTDIGEGLYRRIIAAKKAAQANERNAELVKLALTPTGEGFARIIGKGETKQNVGYDKITYRDGDTEINVEVPTWFKASLEKMPIGHDPSTPKINKGIQLLGMLTGSTPVRALAVGLNPVFAVTNMIRDFGRAYRTYGMTLDRENMNIQNYIKSLVTSNPAMFALKWGKNLIQAAPEAWSKTGDWREAVKNLAIRGRMTMDIANDPYKSFAPWQKVKDVMGKVGSFSEDVTRVALYKDMIARGFDPTRAGTITGEWLDYNRAGTISKIVDAISPFTNVAIQAPRADIRAAKMNPTQYAARLTWGMLLGGLGAYLAKDSDVGDTLSKLQKSQYWWADLGIKDAKGKPMIASVPLEQQDRISIQAGKAIVNALYGKKIDWDAFWQAAKDNLPWSNIKPATFKAYDAVVNNINLNEGTGEPLYYGRTPEPGARHEAYDTMYDSKVSIELAKFMHNVFGVSLQPAMLSYAAQQMFPSSLVTDTSRLVGKVASGEAQMTDIPLVKKFVQIGDPNRPWRTAAQPYAEMTNIQQLRDDRMWRQAGRLKDPNQYVNFLVSWAQTQKDPDKMSHILSAINAGIESRALGQDTAALGYLKGKVDPAYYDEIEKTYKETKGKTLLDKSPTMLKNMIRANAIGGSNGNSGEQ